MSRGDRVSPGLQRGWLHSRATGRCGIPVVHAGNAEFRNYIIDTISTWVQNRMLWYDGDMIYDMMYIIYIRYKHIDVLLTYIYIYISYISKSVYVHLCRSFQRHCGALIELTARWPNCQVGRGRSTVYEGTWSGAIFWEIPTALHTSIRPSRHGAACAAHVDLLVVCLCIMSNRRVCSMPTPSLVFRVAPLCFNSPQDLNPRSGRIFRRSRKFWRARFAGNVGVPPCATNQLH